MPGSFLAASARTPIDKLSGSLSSLTAMELGGAAITAALARAGIEPGEVDQVVMGQASPACTATSPRTSSTTSR